MTSTPNSAGKGEITITRAEARRLVNYAFMASSANWTPFIKENGVGYQDSPWVEFLRIADRLWVVLFPEHPIRQIDPRLPAENGDAVGGTPSAGNEGEAEVLRDEPQHLEPRIRELEGLAEAATKGPWWVIDDAGHPGNKRIRAKTWSHVAKVYANDLTDSDGMAADNAAFIAAFNPTTALSLIRSLRELEAERDRIRGFDTDVIGRALYEATGAFMPWSQQAEGVRTRYRGEALAVARALLKDPGQ